MRMPGPPGVDSAVMVPPAGRTAPSGAMVSALTRAWTGPPCGRGGRPGGPWAGGAGGVGGGRAPGGQDGAGGDAQLQPREGGAGALLGDEPVDLQPWVALEEDE